MPGDKWDGWPLVSRDETGLHVIAGKHCGNPAIFAWCPDIKCYYLQDWIGSRTSREAPIYPTDMAAMEYQYIGRIQTP